MVRLPKAHRVVKPLAVGRWAIHWYRCRGGAPLMRFEGASRAEAEAAELAGAEALAQAWAAPATRPEPAVMTVGEIVIRYKAAPDGFQGLAESTQGQWGRWLDRIRDEFGDLPAAALAARGMRGDILEWRDLWAATPRTADYGMQVLKRVLAFGVERELCDVNPAEGIKGLYSSNRADVIVEPDELKAVLAKAKPKAARAFRVAAGTGLRRGDLVQTMLTDALDFSIELGPRKGRRSKRRVIVPLLREVRQEVAAIRREATNAVRASLYLLTTEKGRPWSEHWLTESWIAAARAAGVDKHFHDLRGTAATRFMIEGRLSDEEIAEIMGWDPKRVTRIRRRYVDRERIARGVVARIERTGK